MDLINEFEEEFLINKDAFKINFPYIKNCLLIKKFKHANINILINKKSTYKTKFHVNNEIFYYFNSDCLCNLFILSKEVQQYINENIFDTNELVLSKTVKYKNSTPLNLQIKKDILKTFDYFHINKIIINLNTNNKNEVKRFNLNFNVNNKFIGKDLDSKLAYGYIDNSQNNNKFNKKSCKDDKNADYLLYYPFKLTSNLRYNKYIKFNNILTIENKKNSKNEFKCIIRKSFQNKNLISYYGIKNFSFLIKNCLLLENYYIDNFCKNKGLNNILLSYKCLTLSNKLNLCVFFNLLSNNYPNIPTKNKISNKLKTNFNIGVCSLINLSKTNYVEINKYCIFLNYNILNCIKLNLIYYSKSNNKNIQNTNIEFKHNYYKNILYNDKKLVFNIIHKLYSDFSIDLSDNLNHNLKFVLSNKSNNLIRLLYNYRYFHNNDNNFNKSKNIFLSFNTYLNIGKNYCFSNYGFDMVIYSE